MMNYNPSDAWPLPILAQFIEVREKRGFHQIYPNGFIRASDYEITLPEIYYNGWTARLFMRRSKELPDVAIEITYSSSYYCKTLIKEGETSIQTSQRGYDQPKDEALGQEAKAGDIYSMGIRLMDDLYLMSVANEAVSAWQSMKSALKGYTYLLKIRSKQDVILSMHMSEEAENNYLRLPQYFDLPGTKHPPGSSIVALLECTDPAADTTFSLDTDGQASDGLVSAKYGKVPGLMKDETFFVYVRNLPDRYMVAASFRSEPFTIAHRSAKDYIHFYRSENCDTLSLTQYIVLGRQS
ncbi:uncharacterized protein [Dermacentor andersoni]|uniref:uncharacterized protein n=1 Tax=Dermacentor andersoni TaxID=34620 RepID=UPI00241603D3|nr:uncharacterized protein LOC129381681 [Dermacentor andersoni]